MTKLFIQGSKIVILVYCINQKKSFESLDYWYNSIMEICGENVVLGIVGNKMDLFDDEEKVEVTEDEGQKYADEKKALFKLVSAKIDKKGIDSLFDQLFDKYIEENTVAKILIKKKEEEFQFLDKNLIKKIRKTNVSK